MESVYRFLDDNKVWTRARACRTRARLLGHKGVGSILVAVDRGHAAVVRPWARCYCGSTLGTPLIAVRPWARRRLVAVRPWASRRSRENARFARARTHQRTALQKSAIVPRTPATQARNARTHARTLPARTHTCATAPRTPARTREGLQLPFLRFARCLHVVSAPTHPSIHPYTHTHQMRLETP